MTNIIQLPNIRSLLKPDPGFILIDADLDRADAQVVAWESGAEKLKTVFRSGADVHTVNALDIYGHVTKRERDLAKAGVHLTNYHGKARTLASTLGIPIREAEEFQRKWFLAHPEIKRWHEKIEQQIQFTRAVHNVWGFRRFYFDRLENIVPQALAWLGQSTVAVTINKAMLNIFHNMPEVQLLLQVHDSLVMQARIEHCPKIFTEILKQMQIVIPYDDPLIIPVSLKYSADSWGRMKEWKLGDEVNLRMAA